MTRTLAKPQPTPHGRLLIGGEPHVFHCNHYNYWLQHSIVLAEDLGLVEAIVDAAAAVAHRFVTNGSEELGLDTPSERLRLAADHFAETGFGTIRFDEVSDRGGVVTTPVSHYGQCLTAACPGGFDRPQNMFDQGFAAGAVAAAYGLPAGALQSSVEACQSMGAKVGVIRISRGEPRDIPPSPGAGKGADVGPGVPAKSSVDEAGILQALSGLDFSGNEEGLLPRFGVMLTLHFANFYNRMSFEYVRRVEKSGMLEAGESLLVDAGHRCALNTFGGIMTSAEWDAVIKPQCKTREDWVHGMVAVINALGWGIYRVAELDETRLVLHIFDDYESRGYLGMYGKASRPICYLAAGAGAGIMNLIFNGDIQSKPKRDHDYYERVFYSDDAYLVEQTKCMAQGEDYTEIVVSR